MDCDEVPSLTKPMILETPETDDLVIARSRMDDVRNRPDDGVESGYCLSLPSSVSPDTDDRKRPLSITSTSSSASSSSSLPRHVRKRIANMSSSAAIGSFGADTGVSNASCEMLTTVAECGSPVDVRCLNSHTGFFDKDLNEPPKSGRSVSEFPLSSPCQYNLSAADDYSATSDVEESTGSSERNSCGCLDGSESKLLTGVAYTERVVAEILETERNYVKDLSNLVQGYIYQIRNDVELELSRNDIDALFGNIETLWRFNRHFLSRLEECGHNPITIANCFVSEIHGFEIYSTYCTNYPRSVETLIRIMKDEKVASFLKRQQTLLQHGLPLGSYLLKPVQRILKYHILLQNIFNNHDASEEGHDIIEKALDSMMNVAQHINEMKRQHEHAVRLQEIQCHLCNWDGTDLMTLGNLILEECFRVCGAKALRRLFLFEKAVLLTKEREDGMLLMKSFISFSNLMVIESVPKEPLSFQLIPYNAPREQVTLQANSLEQKRFWCQWIKKLMLDNYGTKIPDKVKELVMMLGKSREEEDFESSNVEIPELVKKQHNAPAYLEKRKGRRKSVGFINGLRSGRSTSDTAKHKMVGNFSRGRNSIDVLPATDDDEGLVCGNECEKVSESGSHGNCSDVQETSDLYRRTDGSFSSQSSYSPATTPTSKTQEKIALDPSFLARSANVTEDQSVNSSKIEDGVLEKVCGRQSQRTSIGSSQSVASLGKAAKNVEGPCGGSFDRSNSADGELHTLSHDPLSCTGWTDDDLVNDNANRGETIESGDYQIKFYRSLRKPESSSYLLGRKSVSGSLGRHMREEPSNDNFETSDGCHKASTKTITASCSCTKLPSQVNINPGRIMGTPTLGEKCQHSPEIFGRSPKKNLNPRLEVKFSKTLKSNLAQQMIAGDQCYGNESKNEDDQINFMHDALTRLTSRIPAESLQSLDSCSTVRTCVSYSTNSSEKFRTSSMKSEDRKEIRNKLSRLLGRSPDDCQQNDKFQPEGSSPTNLSLGEFLKDRYSLIGERMAISPDPSSDSPFTIANRTTHHRTPLSECKQMFNKTHRESVDDGMGLVESVSENGPEQQHEVKILQLKPEDKVSANTEQLIDRNNSNRCSDAEFYYENKLLEDLEYGFKNDEEGQSSDVRSDDDDDVCTDVLCSPSAKSTVPQSRTAIKETLHSIEHRTNIRPVHKVKVQLGEKAEGMQEILQTLENIRKNGHNSTFYGKVVHRTVRDRSRELAVCAALTRVRQNNCDVVSFESLTMDEGHLPQTINSCGDVGVNESPQPETQTSHL